MYLHRVGYKVPPISKGAEDEQRRQVEPVVRVVPLRAPLKNLSYCDAAPYLRFFLVRNEEAGGSNPLSSTIFQNDLERAKQSYRGMLGLSSLPDSFRYLVIHPERHCLCAAASVNTRTCRYRCPCRNPDYFRITSGSSTIRPEWRRRSSHPGEFPNDAAARLVSDRVYPELLWEGELGAERRYAG